MSSMELFRLATFAATLLIGACDFGVDTKGLSGGDAATGDVVSLDVATSSDSGGPSVLFGDTNQETTSFALAPSTPDGYRFVASASGTAQTVWVYVDAQTTSGTTFDVGVYDEDTTTSPAQPKSLLAQATFSSVTSGAWNSLTLSSSVPVVTNAAYWIVVVTTNGTLYVDRAGGTSGSLESVSATSSTLPTTWSMQSNAMDGPASMYVTN
jgi:hypothetical protein